MNLLEYEIAFFAQTVWRVANSNDTNELLAVACTMRNWVIPKMGQVAGYESYMAACIAFLSTYPNRPVPTLEDEPFISRPEGLLYNIPKIHSCDYPDITSTHDHPGGARYFARVTSLADDDWRKLEIVSKPFGHLLLGTFGSMQFFS